MVRLLAFTYTLLFHLAGLTQQFEVEMIETDFRGSVFSPAFFKQKLVVCSDQKDRIGKTVLDQQGGEPIDLYLIDPINPKKPERFNEIFRTIYNDGPISFNDRSDQCVVSRNLKTEQKIKHLEKDYNPLGIYITKKYEKLWNALKPLHFNNPGYSCSHPAMSEDAKIIIFSSNMPGGHGGFDLWKTINNTGIWSRPINLGEEINTAKNEFFPSLDGQFLYFSSDRGELGGLDIYSCHWLSKNRKVSLLPEPVNSTFDDFGLISKDGLQKGYFSSNRSGIDELWKFDMDFPEFGQCDSLIEEDFCYTLFEENARELDDVGSLIYEWSINGDKKRGVEIEYCFPGPGDYEINLDIIDTLIDQTYFNQAYYFITLNYEVQPYISCPDTVSLKTAFDISAERSNLPEMVIKEYFWDFGDGLKGTELSTSHLYEKTGTYLIRLNVTGYESETKASNCVYKTVVCVEGEIASTKDDLTNIVPDKLGSIDIVKDMQYFNVNPSDSAYVIYSIEAFRSDDELREDDFPYKLLEQYSSRVEYNEEENVFVYYVGRYKEFTEAHKTWLELKKRGLKESILRSLFIQNKGSEISLEEKFILKHVQFDTDDWAIRNDARYELDRVLQLMRELPEFDLVISAHTDNRGSPAHNMRLSEKRAQSVRNYFIERGIGEDRIRAKGYGSTIPIDTNETEEGMQNNRRVEFEFIK
ncbi:OmpA family protein [Crocinitomix catalasitica]|nr:OmpA family protein [Crocinitomix catalasitica]